MTPADDVMLAVAEEIGVAETFTPAPVACSLASLASKSTTLSSVAPTQRGKGAPVAVSA